MATSTGCCWRCLAEWLRLRELPAETPTYERIVEAARLLRQEIGASEPEGVLAIHYGTGDRVLYPVVRRPQCSSCGGADEDVLAATGELENSAQRVKRILQTVNPLTGFITDLRTIQTRRVFRSEAIFVSPHAPGLPRGLRQEVSIAAGLGTSAEQSQTRCIGEAVERYSLVFQGKEQRVAGRWSDLGEIRCDRETIAPFSKAQYARRHEWNSGKWGFPFIPPPLGEEETTEWSFLRSLVHQRNVLLPTQLVYFGSGKGFPLRFVADTNGCAAGETTRDAVLAGLLELIERDAIAIWWYNRLHRPGGGEALTQSRPARPWVSRLRSMNRPYWLLDLTTDIAIPVYAAISAEVTGTRIAMGFGCHPDPERAAAKALRELCQTSGFDEDPGSENWARNGLERAFATFSAECTLRNETHLAPSRASRPMSPLEVRGDLLSHCVRRLAELSFDPLAIILTRPEIRWPVVRVVVQKLCHPWHRFGVARLYDAPLRMHARTKALTEQELNSVPFPL